MALDLNTLRKRPGLIETLVNKVRTKAQFDMADGSIKSFDRFAFTDSGRVVEVTPSKDLRSVQLALDWLKKKSGNSKYVLLVNDKERYTLNDLALSSEFGGVGGKVSKGASKGNNADVLESIYAAAITARFLNGYDMIVEQDIINVLDSLKDNKVKQSLTQYIGNRNKKIKDVVTLNIGGALSAMKTVTDKTMQFTLGDMIQNSLKYANSSTALQWGKLLFENNRKNKIVINAYGGTRRGNKINVIISIDNKKIDVESPLKNEDIKTNGRFIGGSFDEIQVLTKNYFGINLNSYQKQFDNIRSIRGFAPSIVFAYKSFAYEYNKMVKNNKAKMYQVMGDSIGAAASKKVSYIHTTPFSRSEGLLFKNGNFSKIFVSDTMATVKVSKGLPVLNIQDTRGKVLFQIETKQEMKINSSYLNHYVKKGFLVTDLGKYISL